MQGALVAASGRIGRAVDGRKLSSGTSWRPDPPQTAVPYGMEGVSCAAEFLVAVACFCELRAGAGVARSSVRTRSSGTSCRLSRYRAKVARSSHPIHATMRSSLHPPRCNLVVTYFLAECVLAQSIPCAAYWVLTERAKLRPSRHTCGLKGEAKTGSSGGFSMSTPRRSARLTRTAWTPFGNRSVRRLALAFTGPSCIPSPDTQPRVPLT